jgi:putative ABC transport system permease protein
VLRRGMVIVACGAGLGLLGAMAATRLIRGMLFEVGTTDPLIFGLVTVGLVAAGLVACLAPARRATRVDPVVALRAEQ